MLVKPSRRISTVSLACTRLVISSTAPKLVTRVPVSEPVVSGTQQSRVSYLRVRAPHFGVRSAFNQVAGLRSFHSSSTSQLFNHKSKPVATPVKTTVNASIQSKGTPNENSEEAKIASMNHHPILKRIPRFLRPFASRFIHAPITHVTAFVILHELTAIVPLIGVWYVLHKYHWAIPLDLPHWAIERGTKIIDSSMARFDFTDWSVNEKFNFIMEGAYAFVIVKFLMPFRLMISLSLMPSFSRWVVVPTLRLFKKNPKPSQTDQPKLEVQSKKIDKPRL